MGDVAVNVFDPSTENEPQLFHLSCSRKLIPAIEFLARPTRDLAAVKQGFETGRVELRGGKRSPLLDSDTITQLVAVRESKVYFLERPPK